MRFTTNHAEGRATAHLTSSMPPRGWAVTQEVPKTGDRCVARKCPVCFEQYQPDTSDVRPRQSHLSTDQIGHSSTTDWASKVHRRHSAASSISSVSELAAHDRQEESGCRASRFVEDLTSLHDRDEMPGFCVKDSTYLIASGDRAQRRRRRSAQSCGSDDNRLSIGHTFPRQRHHQATDEAVPEPFYHLNGMRMRF